MRLLTTEGLVRSSAAAWVKLRRWATRTKVLSLFRSRRAAVKDIIYFSPFEADPRVVIQVRIPMGVKRRRGARFAGARGRPENNSCSEIVSTHAAGLILQ